MASDVDLGAGDPLTPGDSQSPGDQAPPDLPPLDYDLFLRGTFNAWAADAKFVYVGQNQFVARVRLAAGTHEFKLADRDWQAARTFSASSNTSVTVALDQATPMVTAAGGNNNTKVDLVTAGFYDFDLSVLPGGGQKILKIHSTAAGAVLADGWSEAQEGASFAPVTLPASTATLLGPQELLAKLALAITPPEQAHWALGDNVDGFVESHTHTYDDRTRYWHGQGGWFAGFASLRAGALMDVSSAAVQSEILPYGRTTRFTDGAEQLVLHPGQRALSLVARADAATELGLLLKLRLPRAWTTVERHGQAIVLVLAPGARQAGEPGFIGLATTKPARCGDFDLAAQPAVKAKVGLTPNEVTVFCRSLGQETELRLSVTFGFSATDVAARVSALASRDALGEQQLATWTKLVKSYLWTDDDTYNRALMWAKVAASSLVVQNETQLTGIWAGLPWFRNFWGRDTFISLPGTLLVSGEFAQAKAVLQSFATLQNTNPGDVHYGRVPNLVASTELGSGNIMYNTTDGTPWLMRELWEYWRYTGDAAFAEAMYPKVKTFIEGARTYWVDSQGFLTHADADTWMDARFGQDARYAWSARGSRAVEVQALWLATLRLGVLLATRQGDTASASDWDTLANRLAQSFRDRFWDTAQASLADRLRADDSADHKVRPNAFMALSVPFEEHLLDADREAQVLAKLVPTVVFPYGVTSLDPGHEYFHPYHHNPRYAYDAAYHNGNIWGWSAGPAVTAMCRLGCSEVAYALAKNLGEQILQDGTRGTMSECLDAFLGNSGRVTPTGTFSQAWSVAEYVRNGFQDFVGFRPNLPDGVLELWPALPSAWQSANARLPFGQGASLELGFVRHALSQSFTLTNRDQSTRRVRLLLLANYQRYAIEAELAPNQPVVVTFDEGTAQATVAGGAPFSPPAATSSQAARLSALRFATPNPQASIKALNQDNYLQKIIEAGQFR